MVLPEIPSREYGGKFQLMAEYMPCASHGQHLRRAAWYASVFFVLYYIIIRDVNPVPGTRVPEKNLETLKFITRTYSGTTNQTDVRGYLASHSVHDVHSF